MTIDVGRASDVGLVRESNEDALLLLGPLGSGGAVLAVADGMGGHQAGEVASGLAVEALQQLLTGAAERDDAESALMDAVRHANRAIWEAARTDRAREGMGTTLVCALVAASGRAIVANVGDSRAYVVSGTRAEQVTADHSWVGDQVRAGRMTADDAEHSPYKHILSRSLGVTSDVDVDVFTDLVLGPGDALVLCSDGVSNHLGLEDFGAVVAASASAQEAAERLVDLALDRGGSDNATVVVARRLD